VPIRRNTTGSDVPADIPAPSPPDPSSRELRSRGLPSSPSTSVPSKSPPTSVRFVSKTERRALGRVSAWTCACPASPATATQKRVSSAVCGRMPGRFAACRPNCRCTSSDETSSLNRPTHRSMTRSPLGYGRSFFIYKPKGWFWLSKWFLVSKFRLNLRLILAT